MNKRRKYNFHRGEIVKDAIFVKEWVQNGNRRALFICACGNIHEGDISNEMQKTRIKCKSCFCAELSMIKIQHGHTYGGKTSKAYYTWNHIKSRCLNPNNPYFGRYGGRGIKMFDGWVDNAAECVKYLESLPGYNDESLQTIDRVDNDGDYVPGNLRWASHSEQARNRNLKSTNKTGFHGVVFRGDQYNNPYVSSVGGKYLGVFPSAEDAARARDRFIIEHNLAYNLQVLNTKNDS